MLMANCYPLMTDPVYPPASYPIEEEYTLRDLLLKLRSYLLELWAHKVAILLVAVVSGVGAAYLQFRKAPMYTATLSFMVNEEDSGSSISSLARLAGGFFGGGGGDSNLDRITVLAQSNRIVSQMLFDSVQIGEEADYLANHLIRLYGLHDEWNEAEPASLRSFYFRSADNLTADEEMVKNTALKRCVDLVRGDPEQPGLLRVDYDEATKILELEAITLAPELSLAMVRRVYDHLETYYVSRSIEPQIKSYNVLKAKQDSIENALLVTNGRLARFRDESLNIYTSAPLLPQTRLRQEQFKLQGMLAEVVKNLETSDFLLRNATPYFQAVDVPFPPLRGVKPSPVKWFVIGAALGGLLLVSFYVLRRIFREIMAPGPQATAPNAPTS